MLIWHRCQITLKRILCSFSLQSFQKKRHRCHFHVGEKYYKKTSYEWTLIVIKSTTIEKVLMSIKKIFAKYRSISKRHRRNFNHTMPNDNDVNIFRKCSNFPTPKNIVVILEHFLKYYLHRCRFDIVGLEYIRSHFGILYNQYPDYI